MSQDRRTSGSQDARAARDDRTESRADALAQLVERRLPLEFDVTGDGDAWPFTGAALVSRATTTLRYVVTTRRDGQSIDAATLARSLYEHVVHLAWLAAEPSAARLEEWRKADLVQRLKADADVRSVGNELLTDDARALMQRQVDAMTGNPLKLVNLAVAADKHWAGKLPGMGTHTEQSSYRGMYERDRVPRRRF